MVAKNGMAFPGDSSISSRKIISMKMRQNSRELLPLFCRFENCRFKEKKGGNANAKKAIISPIF